MLPSLLVLLLLPCALGQSPVVYKSKIQGITVGSGNGLSTGPPGKDVAFLTTQDGQVLMIDESNGNVLNRYIPDVSGFCDTVVDWNDASQEIGAYAIGNYVIVIGSDGNKYRSIRINEGEVASQPVVHNNLVYIPSTSDTAAYISFFDPFDTNPTPSVFARQKLNDVMIGPLSKGEYGIYFGDNIGNLYFIDTTQQFDPSAFPIGNSPEGKDLRGRPYVDDTTLVLLSPGGILNWWSVVPVNGGLPSILAPPLLQVDLGSESSAGSLMAPVKSDDSNTFYVVSDFNTFAVRGDGSILWTSEGEAKSKPVVNVGTTVVSVEESGVIETRDASTGTVTSSFTPSCNGELCGTATGYAILSKDRSLVLTVYDDGWLVATCTDCIDVLTPTAPSETPNVGEFPTSGPVTTSPITIAPTTLAPISVRPVSSAPASSAPVTIVPKTETPITALPTSAAPVTAVPITASPITPTPTTPPPISVSTLSPTLATSFPTSVSRRTESPTASSETEINTVTPSSGEDFSVSGIPLTSSPTSAALVTASPTAPMGTEVSTSTPSDDSSSLPSLTPSFMPSSIPSSTPSTSPSSGPTIKPPSEISSVEKSGASRVLSMWLCLSMLLTTVTASWL